MMLKNILKAIFGDSQQEQASGFSTTPQYSGIKKSWEVPKPSSSTPPVNVEKVRQLERRAIIATGGTPSGTRGYPASGIQKATVESVRRANMSRGNSSTWGGGSNNNGSPPPTGPDRERYGFALPRYTVPKRASSAFISGDKFDPKQTLFRYDPRTLNIIEEEAFRSNPANKGRPFTSPYNERDPIYEGFPDRTGAEGYGRLWSSSLDNEKRRYLFDMRDHNQVLEKLVDEKLTKREGVALQTYFAIPATVPDRVSRVSISSWSGSPSTERMITVSRTIGGGEQIIGNPDFFKFKKP